MSFPTILLTLELAFLTTLFLFAIGLPFSYWLATTKWRGRAVLESIVALPLVLPPTVLGFYLLVGLGPESWLGGITERFLGIRLAFSFTGILIGSVIFNLPFAIRPFTASFSQMDRRLIEASWCLGESKLRTFWRITFPLCWPGVVTGIVLTFAHTVGEFGVVLMVGGNIPGVTRTLSIAVFEDVQALDYAAAGRTSILLVVFSLAAMSVVQMLTRRGTSV